MTSSPDNTVAEILYEFLGQFKEDDYLAQDNTDNTVESLDSHYLSIFLETIEKIDKNANPTQQWEVNDLNVRSRLKFELRTALQDRLGEK